MLCNITQAYAFWASTIQTEARLPYSLTQYALFYVDPPSRLPSRHSKKKLHATRQCQQIQDQNCGHPSQCWCCNTLGEI